MKDFAILLNGTKRRIMKHAFYFTVLLALVIVLLCVTGCSQQKPLVQTIETVRTEREVIRDTTVLIQPDSAHIRALFDCDSLNRVIIRELETARGSRIIPTIEQTNAGNVLEIRLECKEDSLKYELQVRDRIIDQLTNDTREVAVPYVPTYYKCVNKGFWVLLAILALIIGLRVFKWYIKHKKVF